MERKVLGGRGKGEALRQFDFLGKNSSIPEAYNNLKMFYAVVHLGSSQSEFELHNFTMLLG
jgi:hypothetical protein